MRHTTGGWQWRDEVYNTNIILLCCEKADIPTAVRGAVVDPRLVEALLSEDAFGGIVGSMARTVWTTRQGYAVSAIWVPPTVSVAIAAHEAFHAASFILAHAGVRLHDASEEAYAYLLEWLLRGIEGCLSGDTVPAILIT